MEGKHFGGIGPVHCIHTSITGKWQHLEIFATQLVIDTQVNVMSHI